MLVQRLVIAAWTVVGPLACLGAWEAASVGRMGENAVTAQVGPLPGADAVDQTAAAPAVAGPWHVGGVVERQLGKRRRYQPVGRLVSSGRLVARTVAAPFSAEATFPHATIGDSAYVCDRVLSIVGTGPSTAARTIDRVSSPAVGAGWAFLSALVPSFTSMDCGNAPPISGCHLSTAKSSSSTRRDTTARPRTGDSSRALRPSWVTEAATRHSMSAAARPAAAASAARTPATRARRTSGSSESWVIGCHARRTAEPATWVSTAK